MKIIYLHQYFKFPRQRGGTRSYDLATSFVKKGHQVVVISSSKEEKYKSRRWTVVKENGLEVHFIHSAYGTQLSYLKRTFVFLKFMFFSTLRILKIQADVVIATSTPLTIGIPALVKKVLNRTPYVFEVRDVWPEAVIAIGAVRGKVMQKWLSFQERTIYKYADFIVPLSTDMQNSIQRRFPEFANKSNIVIENIAEINRFQNKIGSISLDEICGFIPRFTILYAGTFGRVNGIEYVVNLAKETLKKDPSVVFLLVGAGGDKKKVKSLAIDQGVLNQNVFILDPISKEELPKWYNSVDMGSSFVINIRELWANSANKFFDSLASGKPIIINHRGWQAEIIEKENIGYVLPEIIGDEDVDEFLRYTQDTSLHDLQKRNALKKAVASYSLEIAVDKYMIIFKELQSEKC